MAEGMGLAPLKLVEICSSYQIAAPKSARDFNLVAPKLNTLLEKTFCDYDVQLNVELASYVCEPAVYMVSRIIGSKMAGTGANATRHYYVNNSIYKGYMARQFGD